MKITYSSKSRDWKSGLSRDSSLVNRRPVNRGLTVVEYSRPRAYIFTEKLDLHDNSDINLGNN